MNQIELHCQATRGLPTELLADLGRAMAKVDPVATFSACEDHDHCVAVFRAEVKA